MPTSPDATSVRYYAEVIPAFFASAGLETKHGPKILQKNIATDKTLTTKTGTYGWYSIGILEADPKIGNDCSFFDLDVGFVKTRLAKFFKGRNVNLDLQLSCLTVEGLKAAFGINSVTLTEPSIPISTTVDTATTPTIKRIKVASTSGLIVGQRLAILTGTASEFQTYELKHIKAIDTTNKIVTLEQPLEHLPINGATVKVIWKVSVSVGTTMLADGEYRILSYHKDQSISLYWFNTAALSKPGIPETSDNGAAPEKASVSFDILNTWDVDSNNDITSQFFTYDQIYKYT